MILRGLNNGRHGVTVEYSFPTPLESRVHMDMVAGRVSHGLPVFT